MNNSFINLKNISKTFDSKTQSLQVLNNINLTAKKGEFISIIGPSGCGKSTIFRILTSLIKDFTGEVVINNNSLTSYSKKISYMQQKHLLLPWRTLIDNLILPLELEGISKSKARDKVSYHLEEFGLKGFENFYCKQLSGGMKQRANLLRSFMIDSEIMLLDEPFGALDEITRSKMQDFLLNIWNKERRTVLFITHNIEEAIFLSDKIYVLSNRPASILDEIQIDFPRPRNKDMLLTQKFISYKKQLLNSLNL